MILKTRRARWPRLLAKEPESSASGGEVALADFRELHAYLCVRITLQSESQAQAATKGTERAISRAAAS
jgi:hypothetical protein